MKRPTTQRVATSDHQVVLEWQAQGTTIKQVVPSWKEAETWVAAWRPGEQGTRDTPIVGAAPHQAHDLHPNAAKAPGGKAGSRLTMPAYCPLPMGVPTAAKTYDSDPVMAVLLLASNFAVGPDPSTGTTAIFGVDPVDTNQMDGLLLPPTLWDGETRQEFHELAMDVASLSGGHRFLDDDKCGSAESLDQAFRRTRTGHF